MCGACHEFAPKFEEVAEKLQPFQHEIRLARFDITEEDVPEAGQEAGFEIQSTPSLFLVRRNPFRIIPYDGELEAGPVIKWVQSECEYVKL